VTDEKRIRDRERIREVYRGYATSGRERLWDVSNPGFARLSRDRDRTLLDLTLRSLPPTSGHLLDLGCGDGRHIATVLRSRPEVEAVGIDLLDDRIEDAKTRVSGATFVVASADEIPLLASSIDVVTAITLFSSIPSDTMERGAAREIGRVLRPGGWLVWFDLRRDNPWNAAVHGLSERRLAELFPGWHAELRSCTLAPPIARRLGRTTPALYPLLHAIPPLRSHLIGRLRCPT
jgi:ubiquinone/menaquinone biosynthesis C-methylase UbiE